MRILKVDCGFYTVLRAGCLIGLSFCQIELLSQICISRCTTMPVVYMCLQPSAFWTKFPLDVISGRWACDKKRSCAMEPRLRSKRSPPQAELKPGTATSVGQRLIPTELTGLQFLKEAYRKITRFYWPGLGLPRPKAILAWAWLAKAKGHSCHTKKSTLAKTFTEKNE